MAVTQYGIGVVWGITVGNLTLTANGVGRITSAALAKDIKNVEHLDPTTGEIIGITVFDPRRKLDLEVYPSASTLAYAKNAANAMPAPGTTVTLTDTTMTSDINSKTFIVESASIKFSNSDKAVISLSLMNSDNIASYAAITA